MEIVLLVISLVVFFIQNFMLVNAVKKKEKKYWVGTFGIEILSIIISIGLIVYYNNLSGWDSFGGFIYSFLDSILYFIMLCITIISAIVVFEKNQKIKEKKSVNPFVLIIASALIMIGITFLIIEIKDKVIKVETTGTVVDFEEIKTGDGSEYWPIIEYNVDGQEYQDDYPLSDVEIGDSVKVYYYIYDKSSISLYLIDTKSIWIPTIILGLFIIFLRFKDDILKNKAQS
jgi:hypothetical protein